MSNRSLAVAMPIARIANVVWDALTDDAAVSVAVVDVDGVIRYANDAYARSINHTEARDLVGRRLDEIFPEAIGQERIQVVRGVALSGKPVQLRTTWRGVRQRAIIRPLPARANGKRATLVTVRPEQGNEPSSGPRIIQARHVDEGPLASISPRERTVLGLIGAGMTTAQMAQTLGRSTKTIENQRYSLARKLGARNRVELARIALRAGLATPPETVGCERPPRRRRAG